jgi:hypothetical protein
MQKRADDSVRPVFAAFRGRFIALIGAWRNLNRENNALPRVCRSARDAARRTSESPGCPAGRKTVLLMDGQRADWQIETSDI